MQPTTYAKPYSIFFMVMPYGISSGFVTIILPYVLKQNHFSVVQIAGIVSVGVSANIWRFFWGPLADITLSLKRWYWIGVGCCLMMILMLSFIPFNIHNIALITIAVFLSQVAATFVVLPLGGIMAKRIADDKKGAAAGWYQAGNLGGMGLGGGIGLWLTTHYNLGVAGIALIVSSLICALVIVFIKDVTHTSQQSFVGDIKMMGKDILTMFRIPIVVFVVCLICMPIGTGAASNLWSAIAVDWHANADTVALVSGVLSGLISALGCVIGGYFADKFGVWWAYLGSGLLFALVTILMAISAYQSNVFVLGVLAYALMLGLINAAFSAIVLYAIGKTSAATKYSLLSSVGNIPVVYMTSINGWVHDIKGSKFMLMTEALLAVVFVLFSILILQWMNKKNLILKEIV